MGIESELHVQLPDAIPNAVHHAYLTALVRGVCRVVPAVINREHGQSAPGVMTANGSRIYLDGPTLVEIATPEVRDPLDAVTSLLGNERVLLKATESASHLRDLRGCRARFIRCANSYDGHFRGLHLNIGAARAEMSEIAEHLVPFLVSRFYACAGGFSERGFVTSHKNQAIRRVISPDARHDRGIIHIMPETLCSSGLRRMHITHGDAPMSATALYLCLGCTALVVKMLDDGVCVGPALKLADPIAALRQLDVDPSWRTPLALACGDKAGGLDIQEHYLQAAERYVRRAAPSWMTSVVKHWRKTVDTLRRDGPAGLARSLDVYTKWRLYAKYIARRGVTMEVFSRWCKPVESARGYIGNAPTSDVQGYLRECMPAVGHEQLTEQLAQAKLAWSELRRAVALYDEMRVIDILYHDIAVDGLYARLQKAGGIRACVNELAISKAMSAPPRGTRAEARAQAIRECASDATARGTWMEVSTKSKRATFPDPLCSHLVWSQIQKKGVTK